MNIIEWIARAAFAIAGAALAALFFNIIIIPIKERSAREGYVLIAEKTAAEAKFAKVERERKADQIVIESYQVQLSNVRTLDAIKTEQHEQEIADYENALSAAGRTCRIDSADRDWLLKP
jgi:hypothetical protein